MQLYDIYSYRIQSGMARNGVGLDDLLHIILCLLTWDISSALLLQAWMFQVFFCGEISLFALRYLSIEF